MKNLFDLKNDKKHFSQGVGIILITLGTIFIMAWYGGNEGFVQKYPNIVGVVVNAALCFVLCGIGLIATTMHNVRALVIISGVFVLGLGVIGFANFDFSVYEVSHSVFKKISKNDTDFVSMVSALCFTLSGIALLFFSYPKNKDAIGAFQAIVGILLISLALISVYSYIVNISSNFTFKLEQNSLHVIYVLILFDIAVLGLVYYMAETQKIHLGLWVPILVFSSSAAGVILLTFILQINELQRIQYVSQAIAVGTDILEIKQQPQDILLYTILVMGLVFSSILARAVYLTQVSRNKSERLEDTERTLNRAEQIAKLGSWLWDIAHKKVWFSGQALALLGLDPAIHVLDPEVPLKLIHPREFQKLRSKLRELQLGHQKFTETITMTRPDGKERVFYIEGTLSNVSFGSPIEVTGIIQDVTEKKSIESQLGQAQKMEMIGQLTGGLAHDFNNILMVIHGNLELLESGIKDEAQKSRRIKAALGATERGSDLIKRLLGFARKQTLQPTIILLQDSIPNILNLISPTLGESIEISYNVREDTWPIQVDLSLLENSLLNLAVNARDAMQGKGELHFDIQNKSITEIFDVEKYQIEPGDYVKISISDTGAGMTQETMVHVFEPFFTTKTVGQGSGLGLSMVYGFIKQSNGYINIYSEVNRGTTINLYLPRSYASNKPEENAITLNDFKNEGIEKILVVEDEEQLRLLTVEYLKGLGYKVFEASSGPLALKIIAAEPQIHLLVSDVIMPEGLTGPELAEKAMLLNPKLKVLFVTGYPKNALSIHKASHISGTQTMIKPYSMVDLSKKIREILDNKVSH